MVLIDTSIWIGLYRKRNMELGQRMWALVAENQAALCGQIWVEYLGGFRKDEDRKHHERALRAMPSLPPRRSTTNQHY